MPVEMKMWRIDGDSPRVLTTATLPAERQLHEFLLRDPSLLGDSLLVIASELPTPFGGRLDLLAVDGNGNLHVLELKRGRTPREVVAQILDYGSWASGLSYDDVVEHADRHLREHRGLPFAEAFEDVFDTPLPDELNSETRLTLVASELDPSSERIITYLREFGVPINAVFFSYLEDDGRRYLARSWYATSNESAPTAARGTKPSKRATWNGLDWYVSFGGSDRHWTDAHRFGFVSAGGGRFYSRTMRSLPEGARIWVNIPGSGYVGVGTTLGPAVRFDRAQVRVGERWVPLAEQPYTGWYSTADDDDTAEWVVPVAWIDANPQEDAYRVKGMFGSQHSACRLRDEFTIERLVEHFDVEPWAEQDAQGDRGTS